MSQLQRDLRSIFRAHPPERALLTALGHIGVYLGGDYLVVHARFGTQFLSEEFSNTEFEPSDNLRDFINEALSDAMSNGQARCVRLASKPEQDAGPAIIAALLHDEEDEEAGAAAILLRSCTRQQAADTLASFENTLGFLSLLISRPDAADPTATNSAGSAATDAIASAAADDPVRLAFHAAAQVRNAHDYEQVSVGFVSGRRVKVAAICGLEEVRATNPGVKLIRAAMEECLDAEEAILHSGALEAADAPVADYPLHRQWSEGAGGDTVATVPLYCASRVVAVVALRNPAGSGLRPERLAPLQQELEPFGRLVPIARRAGRGLFRHGADSVGAVLRRVLGRTRRRVAISAVGVAAALAWLGWGTLPYSITVPAEVTAADATTVSCPQSGTLLRVLVRPGDAVRRDQVLAELDCREDELRRVELESRLAALAVQGDQLLADGTPVERQVLESQRRLLNAELASVEYRIEQATVRASASGTVLAGDLRDQIGTRITEGTALFQVADLSRVRLILKIPERSILLAREPLASAFSPTARPHEAYPIEQLQIPPVATTEEQDTVFLAHSVVSNAEARMVPGMEGVANLRLARQSAWWVLTHRVTDWLRLTFWV